jgi:hypothetical protein
MNTEQTRNAHPQTPVELIAMLSVFTYTTRHVAFLDFLIQAWQDVFTSMVEEIREEVDTFRFEVSRI